jgi:3'(2'), 5'-bisphosphate nucleotidase
MNDRVFGRTTTNQKGIISMYEKELDVAMNLCREAGRIVLEHYGDDVDVRMKKDDSPVTRADKASNAYITANLQKVFPQDGLLAEESRDNAERLGRERVWIVDPMDGTREFIDQIGQFAVMIGLAHHNRPVLGVVYQPTLDKLFYAVRDQGAFLLLGRDKKQVHVSATAAIPDMRLVVSRSHRSHLVDRIKGSLRIDEEVASGSVGLKVGLLIENKSDLYMHPNSKTKEWDTCAPEIILTEAGGRMTDCWGSALRYNKRNTFNDKGFIASNNQKHNEIIAAIEPFLAEMD